MSYDFVRNGVAYNSEDEANLASVIPLAYADNSLAAGYIAEAILDSDWIRAHDVQVRREALEALLVSEPTWPRGMYGSPHDMWSRPAIRARAEEGQS